MRSTLDELTRELNELTTLVTSITPVNAALAAHEDVQVQQYVRIRRRFDYSAFAVALYASFEKFIEDLVAEIAHLAARRTRYAELPGKLLKKHLFRTAELLSRGRLGEGRYAALSETDVVKNLFECLHGVTPYKLNVAAVVAHDVNLRAAEIDELFAAVGIEKICDDVRRSDALLEWYRTSKNLADSSEDGATVSETTVDERLRDVVERRNQVAHRGGNPDELLGVAQMQDAIEFIKAFANSAFARAVGQYLQDNYIASGRGISLRKRKNGGPFKSGTVVIVEVPLERLYVGQTAFVIVGKSARWGRIQSLRIDDVDVDEVEPDSVASNGIGVGLDFKCPKDGEVVALAVDDDIVWPPSSG